MSDNSADDERGEGETHTQYITEVLYELCKSDELSIKSLQETINNPLIRTDYNYDKQSLRYVFHQACDNENVTLEIIELLLHYINNVRGFPNVAQVVSNEFAALVDGDTDSMNEAYPLHVACCNENCPNDVIRLLIEQYPLALKHLSNINDADNEIAGLPLHYYLAQNKNVDIDIIKMMVKAYPESLVVARGVACSPIHSLLYNESTSNLQDILACVIELEGIDVYTLDDNDRTMLHLACGHKNVTFELFKFIFNIWPEGIRLRDTSGETPLHYLCSNDDPNHTTSLDILQYMVSIDPTLVRESSGHGYLLIHCAVKGKSTEFCKVLIDLYPESVRIASNNGDLPIHDACWSNNVDKIQYMLDLYPESTNVRNSDGELPIHHAATNGSAKTIELLLKHDPDMASKNTTDNNRQLPLHIACQYCKRPKAIQVLYDVFPEASLVLDADGKPPTQLVKKGRKKVFKFFRDQYEYVKKLKDVGIMHSPDKNGWLPLHHALKDNVSLGTIKLIVKNCPAAVRMADDKLAFPIHIACEFTSVKVVKYLVEYDSIPMGQLDTNKDSILHYACRGGNLDVVKYLLDNSFVSSAEMNGHGELPTHLLCEAGKDKVDVDSAEYVETIWLMLLANPEAVMS